jgi:protein involved in polysaccharide export with SLBB domain
MLTKPRSTMVPIDLSLLRQDPPQAHVIGPRDVLGIYIQGVLPSTSERGEPNVANVPVLTQQDYYPPRGMINSPAVGLPMEVPLDGKLSLPLVPPIEVQGLTLAEATERIRKAYVVDKKVLEPGRERILISLVRPRVHRILVMRDDITSVNPAVYQPQGNAALLARRGTGNVLDLPTYENDVLHALAATGGLPGVDAFSTVWIFRSRALKPEEMQALKRQVDMGENPESLLQLARNRRSAVCIPLRVYPDQAPPFAPEDVILEAGDVVYLQTRQTEYFFSGGLLPAGQIPLPRDYDLDVIGAVSLATGSVGGPAGGVAASSSNFKGIYNPGNIVPPSRVLVLRTLPNGEQIEIRVDLRKALRDPRERLIIAPGDVVMLYYKPGEVATNYTINILTFNIASIVGDSINK